MSREIRVSASRIKSLWDCTLSFWYKEIQRLPENTHWKTLVGTVTHAAFEVVMHPRRVPLLRAIMLGGTFDIRAYPSVARFVRHQLEHHKIADRCTVEDVGQLLDVAWQGIRPYFTETKDGVLVYSPPPRYHNEHRFKLAVGGAVLSGFIDLLMLWPDRAVIADLKTAREKFTRADVPHNVQAAIYQLAIHREFGVLAPVEFIMLRHPPSKRYPQMHIQRVEQPPESALVGLADYVEHMYGVVNSFSLQDAYSHPHDSHSFCTHVCQFYKPFTYRAIVKKDALDGEPIKTFTMDAALPTLAKDEILIERSHLGCFARWRGDGA